MGILTSAVAPDVFSPCMYVISTGSQVPASRYRCAGDVCRDGRIVMTLSHTLHLSRGRHATHDLMQQNRRRASEH